MDATFDEIQKEAEAYFKKEEAELREKARVDKIWLMRNYHQLKSRVSDFNRMKDKEKASAARKALKEFRKLHNLKA